MKTALRSPVAHDYIAIGSWINNAHECSRWAGPKLQFPFAAQDLSELLHRDRIRSFSMSSLEEDFLGFGQFFPKSDKVAHFARIIISPNRRGQGLGRELLSLLVREAIKALQPKFLTLGVYRDNEAALSLYSKFGFNELESESNAELIAMRIDVKQTLETKGSSWTIENGR